MGVRFSLWALSFDILGGMPDPRSESTSTSEFPSTVQFTLECLPDDLERTTTVDSVKACISSCLTNLKTNLSENKAHPQVQQKAIQHVAREVTQHLDHLHIVGINRRIIENHFTRVCERYELFTPDFSQLEAEKEEATSYPERAKQIYLDTLKGILQKNFYTTEDCLETLGQFFSSVRADKKLSSQEVLDIFTSLNKALYEFDPVPHNLNRPTQEAHVQALRSLDNLIAEFKAGSSRSSGSADDVSPLRA